MKFIKLISFLFIVLFFGCKKYPEDERRYIARSPGNRITAHIWKVDKLEINGIDSTNRQYVKLNSNSNGASTIFSFNEVKFQFSSSEYPEDDPSLGLSKTLTMTPFCTTNEGAWGFSKDKNQIYIKQRYWTINYSNFKLNTSNNQWNILKLTKEELIIENNEVSRSLKIILKAE